MATLLRKQRISGGQLDLGRMSTILDCTLSNVTLSAVEGDAQIVGSTLERCDLRKVPAASLDDCELVDCRLPRGVDARRNRIREAGHLDPAGGHGLYA